MISRRDGIVFMVKVGRKLQHLVSPLVNVEPSAQGGWRAFIQVKARIESFVKYATTGKETAVVGITRSVCEIVVPSLFMNLLCHLHVTHVIVPQKVKHQFPLDHVLFPVPFLNGRRAFASER
jgi:hypothetical protein